MHLKLRDQQLKTILFIYRLLYQNFSVTKTHSTLDKHRKKKKESKHNTKIVIKSQEKRTKEEGKKDTYENKSKTINKMTTRIHILIVTLNVNRLNAPTKKTQPG